MAVVPTYTTMAVMNTWNSWKLMGSAAAGSPMRIQSGRMTLERTRSRFCVTWRTLKRSTIQSIREASTQEMAVARATP